LIVVVPSNPADAKGLMKTALRAHDPVIFMEHKALFGSKGQVPTEEHYVPFGQAKIVQEGTDLTIVSCGLLLQHSVTAAKTLEAQGISCEVIDLRTIVPLDVDTVAASVAKTGKLLIVDEAWSMCGVAAEISAAMMELAFDELDAPIGRICTDPVSFPFSPALENEFIITPEKIVTAAQDVLAGRPIPQIRFTAKTAKAEVSAAVIPQAPEPTAAETKPAPQAGPAKATVEGIPIIMPNQDLTITEAKVVRWLKQLGDAVKTGEPVVEVETDKAVSEIESPADGILAEILAPEEAVVPLAESLAIIKPN
jgi:2-oxoisovalerate dehydrogenase E1 component